MAKYIYIAFWILLLAIVEYPFVLRYIKAKNEFELIRQTAIVILMVLTALLVGGLGYSGYLILKIIL